MSRDRNDQKTSDVCKLAIPIFLKTKKAANDIEAFEFI